MRAAPLKAPCLALLEICNIRAGSAAAAPTVSGGAAPVLVIEKPASGDSIGTKNPFTVMGYALDKNASATQGSRGTGIDRVSVYVDAERDNGGAFVGDADLAFNDPVPQSTYGAQVSSAGWRLTFKPTSLHKGSHTFFVYAHSVVTGKEDLETVGFNIVENS